MLTGEAIFSNSEVLAHLRERKLEPGTPEYEAERAKFLPAENIGGSSDRYVYGPDIGIDPPALSHRFDVVS